MKTRTEHDTMGSVELPYDAYYGPQTQRAVENFPISGRTLPKELIHALGLVKWAAAKANWELGMFKKHVKRPLSEKEYEALLQAAQEVADGKFDDQFPVDVYQTGSGTSTNMNANEVIANRANEILGFDFRESEQNSAKTESAAPHSARAGGVAKRSPRVKPPKDATSKRRSHEGYGGVPPTPPAHAQSSVPIHPNDHVNCGQSTNDIFPTAIHVALVQLLYFDLSLKLGEMSMILDEKAEAWNQVLKIGRTHLTDATPLTLGQEFSGLARQLALAESRVYDAIHQLLELPVGGTAVGTGINTHPGFGKLVAELLYFQDTFFQESENHFEANAQRDGLVSAHAAIKSIAVTLMNVANNIRWLGSGPRCGFYEIIIPDLQPGSSIMPGKVNPVLCEALMQACAKVIGNDQTITTCGAVGGQFQLNIMMPVMADVAIESVTILSGALEVFTEKCLKGLEPNIDKCREGVEKSLSLATGLNTLIGYEKAAALVKEAFQTGKTIRELVVEQDLLTPEQIEQGLDPWKMVKPLE